MPELAEDIARRVAQNEVRLVPAEGQTGYYLGVTGQNPLRYAFLQPPDDEIPRFAGSPDGELGAPIDSLVRNTDDHTVWINTDGDTAWQQVGSGGGGGSPSDWVEWFVDAAAQTGLAYFGALVGIDWDDSGSSGITHGTAITLNGSGNAVVNEDGYYALDCYVMVGADANDTLWDEALFQLTVVKSFSIGGDVMDNAIDIVSIPPIAEAGQQAYGAMTFTWTGYLEATNTVELKARMRAGADPTDTWSVFDGSFRMEKLPM